MLIISYGKQNERLTDLSPASSAFVSCVATLANGLIGVRPDIPAASERTQRVQLLVNGVYASGFGVSREIVSLPAPRILRLYDVETGQPACRLDGTTATVRLSLEDATVTSSECLQVGGETFEMTVRQFIDVSDKPKVSTVIDLQRTSSEGAEPRRLRLDYGIDASAVNEYLGTSPWLTVRYYHIEQCECCDDSFSVVVVTAEHGLRYDVQIERSPFSASIAATWERVAHSCTISTTFDFSLANNHQLCTHWQVCTESGVAGPRIPATPCNFATTEKEHRDRWTKLWENHSVTINANGEPIELGMRYAIFQLLQHGIDSRNHTFGAISPARGLTSTYHSGATFFDTELHKCIFWIWNDPSTARALIDYRYHRIEKAVEFSRLTGFSGARFPEASNDHGTENGPHYVLSYPSVEVMREWSVDEVLHISADVCYALYRYWVATGDDAYMNNRGCRIVSECSRFCASAFKWSDNKQAYVINHVMGPDEYHYHVNNSFYTNYLLRWCLDFAISLIDRGFTLTACANEVDHWRTIIHNVHLPWMDVNGILIPEEFDGYAALPETQLRLAKKRGPQFADDIERNSAEKLHNFTSKVVKQADIVLLMSLFPDDFSDEVKRTAFNFYEPRTVHESSLSYGPHAIVAADIGKTEDCAYFITRASRYNLDFTPITDYSNGLHLSAYAGAWQGLVEGLAGLRVDGSRLYFRPHLPRHWNSYQFTIYFRGQRLQITVPADGLVNVYCEGREFPITRHSDGYVYSCGESE